MVTIEQKVLLFSKLIDQIMSTKFKEGLINLENEYIQKLEKNMKDTDLEVKKIIDNAHKKKDLEVSKTLSTKRINEKKEQMLAKENCFNKLMDSLKLYINEFINSDKYSDYLLRLITNLNLEQNHLNNITIYVTNNDYNKYSDLLNLEFKKIGYNEDSFRINVAKDNIIGGFLIDDNINKFRIDLSVKALLDDNKAYIMQTLFDALEVGGNNE